MTELVVLIVDDDDRNRKLARDLLALDGIETLEAATAEDGLAAAAAAGPDLVLLDLRLPDLDGTEALRRLRDDPATAGLRVVAVTAVPDARAALLAAGFDGYLEKPIDALAFAAQVRALAGTGG
jgi:two-component system cell cycle response regulator DivK